MAHVENRTDAIQRARALGLKYLPASDVEEELKIKMDCMVVYEMEIEHLSGKLVYEI